MPTTVSCLFALVIEINGYKELLLGSKVSGAVQIIMMQNHFAGVIMEYLYRPLHLGLFSRIYNDSFVIAQ